MTAYRCLVVTGEGRTDWRTIDAASERIAVAHLAADGLTAIDVKSGAMGLLERLNQPVRIGRGLGLAERSLILTQLAMLVRSGFPVDRSLDLLRDQAPRASVRDFLSQVLAQVRSGRGLAQALEARAVFPSYVIGVVRSAERSGRLGEALTSLATRMAMEAATRRQLLTALTYPAAVLVATLLALMLVLLIVVPQFEPLFEGEEARLPALTRVVLAMSRAADGGVLPGLLLVGALIVACRSFLRSGSGIAFVGRYRTRIPGIGLRDQYLAAQFTGLMGTLTGNGVPVVTALPLARGGISSRRWQSHIEAVERRVREGESLSQALGRHEFVPRTAVRLIEVGERSGKLADTCVKASDILSDAARARIDRIVALANPIAIVSLGGIVAMLVAGVMLGIFALGDFAG